MGINDEILTNPMHLEQSRSTCPIGAIEIGPEVIRNSLLLQSRLLVQNPPISPQVTTHPAQVRYWPGGRQGERVLIDPSWLAGFPQNDTPKVEYPSTPISEEFAKTQKGSQRWSYHRTCPDWLGFRVKLVVSPTRPNKIEDVLVQLYCVFVIERAVFFGCFGDNVLNLIIVVSPKTHGRKTL